MPIDAFRDRLNELRRDVRTQPEKVVAMMEEKLADNIRVMEEGWRSSDPAMDTMELLDELFNVPQPIHVLERCLEICRGFNKIEDGLITPKYFILLTALIKDATMKGRLQ
jgi:hypothetical protein